MNISEDIGTRLLFENDRVRVWDLALAPGESTGMHRHENDYLYVVIGGGLSRAFLQRGPNARPAIWRMGRCNGEMSMAKMFTRLSMWGWSLAEYYCGVKGIKKAGTIACPLFFVPTGWRGGRQRRLGRRGLRYRRGPRCRLRRFCAECGA